MHGICLALLLNCFIGCNPSINFWLSKSVFLWLLLLSWLRFFLAVAPVLAMYETMFACFWLSKPCVFSDFCSFICIILIIYSWPSNLVHFLTVAPVAVICKSGLRQHVHFGCIIVCYHLIFEEVLLSSYWSIILAYNCAITLLVVFVWNHHSWFLVVLFSCVFHLRTILASCKWNTHH